MRVISHRNVMNAARRHPRSILPVQRWFDLAIQAEAGSLIALRRTFPTADQIGGTMVFNIGGNNYRLVCCVSWPRQTLYFRALLTHAEYDRLNLEELCPQ